MADGTNRAGPVGRGRAAVDDVDRVLARLSEHLRSPDLEPTAREHISDDIDALLERRRWFTVLGRDSTPS